MLGWRGEHRASSAASFAIGLAALFSGACERSGPPGVPAPRYWEVLERASGLASRHRLAEALATIETECPRPDLDALWSDAEVALRERQARLLVAFSRADEAIELLEAVIRHHPGRASARVHLARAHLDAGRAARALELYEELAPEFLRRELLEYARALVDGGRVEDALAAAAAHLVQDPWSEPGYFVLGRAWVRAGRDALGALFLERYRDGEPWRQAEEDAVELEYSGRPARALVRRAKAELARGRMYDAMELCRQATAVEPGAGEAYLVLADISTRLCQPDDAVRVLEKLPADSKVLAALARSYEAGGDAAKAQGAYARILDGAPEDPGARAALARLERGEKPSPWALAADPALLHVWEEVRGEVESLPLSGSAERLSRLVDAYLYHGREEDARSLALFLWRLRPGEGGVLERLRRAFARRDDAFVRAWARTRGGEASAPGALEEELGPLGVDRDRVDRALRGEALRGR